MAQQYLLYVYNKALEGFSFKNNLNTFYMDLFKYL